MKFLKQATWICNSKAIEVYPNQRADLLKILFTDNSWKKMSGSSLQATFFL